MDRPQNVPDRGVTFRVGYRVEGLHVVGGRIASATARSNGPALEPLKRTDELRWAAGQPNLFDVG